MASITIQSLDDATTRRLRLRVALHGLSMVEARRLLKEILAPAPPPRLGQHLGDRFAGVAGTAFEPPARQAPRRSPCWDEGT